MVIKGLIVLSLFSLNSYAVTKECTSTKEFVTTLNFLKTKKEFEIPENKKIELAKSISEGCSGAAARFIQTVNLLVEAEVPTKAAISTAQQVAATSDKVSNNFTNIFKKIYVEKYFDLSTEKSLMIATDLTLKNDKDADKVLADFTALGDFCMGKNGPELSYDKCATFVHSVLMKSKDLDVKVGQEVIEFFDYLIKDEKGPKMTTTNALKEVEKISEFGVNGIKNYKEAFSFAINPQGLNLAISPAIKIAEEMASNSIKK